MIKFLSILILILFFNNPAFACPGCAGSMDNPGDQNVVYILMIFIALTYIPFYLLYKTVWKYRNLNKIETI